MTNLRDLLHSVADLGADHIEGLDQRTAAPSPSALGALGDLDIALPERGREPSEVIAELAAIAGPAAMGSPGGRYYGFVNGGTLPAALAADWLVSAWDQNAASSVMSPSSVAVEGVALGWIRDALGLPSSADGAFVTGATMASASGLAAGRDAVLRRVDWDVEAGGLFGAPPVTVYVGEEVHAAVLKALQLVGLGRDRVVRLPVDDQGAIVAEQLPEVAGPAIVCLQAGNVNSGASDPFDPLIDWAHDAGAWVHVDGAFGLWAAACSRLAAQVAGVERADSWATDAHKWLNVPYDSGVVMVRRAADLSAVMRLSAAYLPGADREPMHMAPQSSQRARGVVAWAALRQLGRRGLDELVDRSCRHAARFADAMVSAGHEVLNDVVLNQVVVAFGDDEQTAAVVESIQADGRIWAGPTVWQGRTAMRFSVSSWATTADDIEAAIAATLDAARSVDEPGSRSS